MAEMLANPRCGAPGRRPSCANLSAAGAGDPCGAAGWPDPPPPDGGGCVRMLSASAPAARRRVARRLSERRVRVELWLHAGSGWRAPFTRAMMPFAAAQLRSAGGVVDELVYVQCVYGCTIVDGRNAREAEAVALYEEVVGPLPQPARDAVRVVNSTLNTIFDASAYAAMVGPPGTLIFKIDDDVSFVRPGSLEHMLDTWFAHARRTGRDPGIVTANVLNCAA
eukprot:gene1264-17442_t